MAASEFRLEDGRDHEERAFAPEDWSLQLPSTGLTGEMWSLLFECDGAPRQRDCVELVVDKAYITFFNMICLKDKLGYSGRDYLFYLKRCGSDTATLEVIDHDHQARAMLEDNAAERKLRLILTKEPPKELQVSITPLKRSREQQTDEQPCMEEDLDAYKVWLARLQEEDPNTEFKDDYRQDTIKTYKKWLAQHGEIPDARTNDLLNIPDEETHDIGQSIAHWPSHARRHKDKENGESGEGKKKGVRGPLKGHSVAYKRVKSGSQKLEIQFSSRLGGSIGINHRSFVDEVTMFTRKRAPLIGVRSWKDIKQNVKDSIASDMMNRWDFQNVVNLEQKIWTVARSRYTGWRSTLSATYKAYKSNAARMKYKPPDVHDVEWHYLMKYFSTTKFKNLSRSNSGNRKEQKNKHSGGSKSFSQHSYEKRNPETGEEPNDLNLWMITHTKNGIWSSLASQDVYENAVLNVRAREQEQELERGSLTQEEQNIIFQSSYREIMGCKRTAVHGHGYMAKYPTRAELMDAQIEQAHAIAAEKERNKHLEAEFQRLKEQYANEAAGTDRKVEEARRQIQEEERVKREEFRQQLKDEMATWFAEQRQALSTQTTNPPSNIQTDDEARWPIASQGNGNNGNPQVARNLFQKNNRSLQLLEFFT